MTRHAAESAARALRDGKLPRGAHWHPEFGEGAWAVLPNGVEVCWVVGFPTGTWRVLDGETSTTVAAAGRAILASEAKDQGES